MKKKVNAICIKWGDVYDAEYVNILKNMIKRHTTAFDVDFYCFTENSDGLDDDVIVKPLPILDTIPEYQMKYAYIKEAGLCDDNLGGLNGERVFFFDLDVAIVGNLDDFFAYPQEDMFYIIEDWNSKKGTVGQASVYSWVVGTLGFVKRDYEKDPVAIVEKFFTASQEYLSSKVIERYGALNFWPKRWFASFRFHCMPKFGPLRHFITPKLPNWPELKGVIFHGRPKPREAIDGVWDLHDKPKWKRLYLTCKPTPWVAEYWK